MSDLETNDQILKAVAGSGITDRQLNIVVRTIAHGETLRKIAQEIGVSESRVKQIRDVGLRKLRKAAKKQGMKE
jgi:DNA-directed RNA polymerase sigma subunit (sigma70/sigma32)